MNTVSDFMVSPHTGRESRISEARFLRNARESAVAGFVLLCGECGCGILDDSDSHDMYCSQYEDLTI